MNTERQAIVWFNAFGATADGDVIESAIYLPKDIVLTGKYKAVGGEVVKLPPTDPEVQPKVCCRLSNPPKYDGLF